MPKTDKPYQRQINHARGGQVKSKLSIRTNSKDKSEQNRYEESKTGII